MDKCQKPHSYVTMKESKIEPGHSFLSGDVSMRTPITESEDTLVQVQPEESCAGTVRARSDKSDTEEESDSSLSYISDASWPDFDIPGSWGTYGLENDPWNDADKPCVHFKNYEDLEKTTQEAQGILTERIIASCSSYLDRCPQTGKYVLCKCVLKQKNLDNIDILMFHHYLQYLDLSWNNLTSLEPLGQLPFLMYLDVSHNMLTDVLNFKAPYNLTYVNFSHNYIDMILDLSSFWSIVYLDISHNQVFQINGLEKLKYLRHLDLSYNQIKVLKGLNNMRLTHLNLANNQIGTFEEGFHVGLKTLQELIVLNVSNNQLESLRFLEGVTQLQKFTAVNNNIKYLYELESLKQLLYLSEVNLTGNPIATDKNYYEVCLNCIKPIVLLDGDYVSAEDKVLASTKYNSSPFMDSSKNHADLFLLERLACCEVNKMILPINKSPPPMIVLVGPPGSGQKKMIQEFYEKYKKNLCMVISHTTRPKNCNEVEGVSYYFVSEEKFEDMVKNAEFVTVSNILGYAYGFSYDELMKCQDQNMVLLLHTDIVGALNLRMRSLRPFLVLTLYLQNESYYAQLMKKYYYTYWLSRDYKALRIINDSGRMESSISSEISADVEDILRELIANLPLKEGRVSKTGTKSFVKFSETTPSYMGQNVSHLYSDQSFSETGSPAISDEMISLMLASKKDGDSSFNLTSEDVFHSISQVEFDFEPILSVVSDHRLDEETEDSDRTERHLKPNQRIDNFIQSILATRERYVEFHRKNPGIFCETIFTDKIEMSLHKLEAVLKQALNRDTKPWHSYSFEKDPIFEDFMSDRLRGLYAGMEKM